VFLDPITFVSAKSPSNCQNPVLELLLEMFFDLVRDAWLAYENRNVLVPLAERCGLCPNYLVGFFVPGNPSDLHLPCLCGYETITEARIVFVFRNESEDRICVRWWQGRSRGQFCGPERKVPERSGKRRRNISVGLFNEPARLTERKQELRYEVGFVYTDPSVYCQESSLQRPAPFAETVPLEQEPAADLVNCTDNELWYRGDNRPLSVIHQLTPKLDNPKNIRWVSA
jgi:hypothetical protein